MKLKIVITILYVIFLGQFLYSNFVSVAGPHFTIQSAAYKKTYKENHDLISCPPQDQIPVNSGEENCTFLCPLQSGDIEFSPPPTKGFPFTISGSYKGLCDTAFMPEPSNDFTAARILNILYMSTITALFGVGYYKVGSSKKGLKTKP